MSDAFLTLAKTGGDGGGLSCFLVPRWLPAGGVRNAGFVVQRLKDKLGDRSNASSEVEYYGAYGDMVGREGRGVATIIQMVNHTRLDCALGSAGILRAATAHAVHHCGGRSAFGATLRNQPLMSSVLADLAVESEAATALSFRIAASFDDAAADAAEGGGDGETAAFSRLATAVAKYWVCKRTPGFVYEAMECHGGNGFVEDDGAVMARLYRQAPLNSIWEGSGNVICLDVLRALTGAGGGVAAAAFQRELGRARGADARLDAYVASCSARMDSVVAAVRRGGAAEALAAQRGARGLVEHMAKALQASLLVTGVDADPAGAPVAEAFLATRLPAVLSTNASADGGWADTGAGGAVGACTGMLPAATLADIVDRAAPR
jgi:putative acyl-CoA dehydrogenase